jgi:hypothetical protein
MAAICRDSAESKTEQIEILMSHACTKKTSVDLPKEEVILQVSKMLVRGRER